MPGVGDAFFKEEEMSDEEPWPPEVQQAPPGIVGARSSTAPPRFGEAAEREEGGASSGHGGFKSSDKNYGCRW